MKKWRLRAVLSALDPRTTTRRYTVHWNWFTGGRFESFWSANVALMLFHSEVVRQTAPCIWVEDEFTGECLATWSDPDRRYPVVELETGRFVGWSNPDGSIER